MKQSSSLAHKVLAAADLALETVTIGSSVVNLPYDSSGCYQADGVLVQQLQADRGGERERAPYIVSEKDAGRRVPWMHAGDMAVQRAMQGGQVGGLEACLG